VQRREVLEQDLVLRGLGRVGVDLVDLDQREVALAVFGVRISPSIESPVCRLKRRICEGLT